MAVAFDSPRIPNGTGDALWKGRDMTKLNQCECCPYGYHIDLDFVRFCEKVSQRSDATLNRERRRERRRQRQSMEVLLGLTSQSFWNIEQQLPKIPQDTVVVDAPSDTVETSNLVRDALHKAVQDFEDTFERTHKPPVTHELDGFAEGQAEVDESAATSLSSMSAESGPVMTQDVVGHDNLLHDFDVASVGSAASGHSHAALQNVRQQMALSLERMRDLEEQVKLIPVLQVQLAVAKEEKRKMQLCLREEQIKKGASKTYSDIELTDLSSVYTNPSLSSTSIAQISTASLVPVSDIASVSATVSKTDVKELTEEGATDQGKSDVDVESLQKTEDWLLSRQLEVLYAQGAFIDPAFEMAAHRSVSTSSLAVQAKSSTDLLAQGRIASTKGQAEKPIPAKQSKSHQTVFYVVRDKTKPKRRPMWFTDPGPSSWIADREVDGEGLDRKSRPRERTTSGTEVTTKEPSQSKSKAIREVGIQTLSTATNSGNQLDEGEQGVSAQTSQTTLPRDSSVSLRTMDSHPARHNLEQSVSNTTVSSDTVSSISIKAFENFIHHYDCHSSCPKFAEKDEQIKAYTNILKTFLESHGFSDQYTQSDTDKSLSQPQKPSTKTAVQEQVSSKTTKIQKISLQTLGEVRLPVEACETREDPTLAAGQLGLPIQLSEALQLVDTLTSKELCRSCLQERSEQTESIDSSIQTSEENLTVQECKKQYVDASIQTNDNVPSREMTDFSVQTSDVSVSTLEPLSLNDLQATETQISTHKKSLSIETQYKQPMEECTVESHKKIKPFSYKMIDNSSQYDENDFTDNYPTSLKLKSKLSISEAPRPMREVENNASVEKGTAIDKHRRDDHTSDITRAPVSLALLSQPPTDGTTDSQHHMESSTLARQVKQTSLLKHEQKVVLKNQSVQTDKQKVTQKHESVQTEKQKMKQKNEWVQTEKKKVVQKNESVQTDTKKIVQKNVLVQTDKISLPEPEQIKSRDLFKQELTIIKRNESVQNDCPSEEVPKDRATVERGVGDTSTDECCVMCGASVQLKSDPRKRSRSQDRDSKIPRPAPPTDHARKLLRQSTYTKIEVPEVVEPETTHEQLWTSLVELNPRSEADLTPASSLPASLSEDKKAVVNVGNVMLAYDGTKQQKYGAAAMSTASSTSRVKSQAAGSSSSTPNIRIKHRTEENTGSSVYSCSSAMEEDSVTVQVAESSSTSTIATNSDFSFPSEITSEVSKNSQSLPSSSVIRMQDTSSENMSSVSGQLVSIWDQREVHVKTLPLTQLGPIPIIKRFHGSQPPEPPLLPQPFASPSFYELTQQCAKASPKGASEKFIMPSTSEKISDSVSLMASGKGSKGKGTAHKLDDAKSDAVIVSSKKSVGPRSDRPALKDNRSPKLVSATEAVPSSSQSRSTRESWAKESEAPTSLGESYLTPSQHFGPNQQSSTWDTVHSVQQSIQRNNSGDPNATARDGLLQSSREDILNMSERERPKKVEPSTKMKAALKVVNDLLEKSQVTSDIGSTAKAANAIIQREWFQISSTPSADPHIVEDYLDHFEEMSSALLTYVVNMADKAGNTAMHYALSQGNFDVVSILLDSKVCNINLPNAAGYTAVMLVSLAQIRSDTHKCVLQRFLADADVNVRAQQHGQTALMLAVSHNRLDMVQLLIEGGADLNIQDDDGSTALMCAAEHGHAAIVQFLINQPDTDLNIKDVDGLTALDIALDAGHKDVGILLYAHKHFSRNNSPYSSLRGRRSKSATPTTRTASTPPPKTPSSPLPARHNPRHSHD